MTEPFQNTAPSSQATFLVTWNPNSGKPMVREGQVQLETCFSTKSQPQRGDRVYLLRRRDDLRGIVARGTVTKGSFESADRDDPSKTRHYFEYLAEETRADCVAGLLPMVLLEQLLQSSFEWRAQSTGFQIPPAEAQQLEQVWEAGRGLHSLAQCARWYQKQPEWYNDTWKPQYSARVASLAAIKAGQQPLDDATLEWLWLTTNNSICDVRPGFLPKAEYQNNIELLRELGTLILRSPGQAAYKQVFARWSEAQGEGRFRQCYRAVIHRVFAAAAPERYTTAVNVNHCRALLKRFASDFELKTTKSSDWIESNQSIKEAMKQAGVPQDDPISNNILAWRLYEAFTNEPAMTEATNEPADSQPANDTENEDPVMNETPLNQILFGPPGTGKTYHTIDKALAILDPAWLATHKADRPALKARFDELVKEGRIEFVTFHQSFSYEDFVEGIRAESGEESGQLRYEVVDGVFKRLCNATWSNQSQSGDEEIKPTDRVIYFRFGQMAKFEAEIASAINDKRIQFDKLDVRLGDLVLLAEGTQVLRAVGRVVDISEEHQSGQLVASLRWLRVFKTSVNIEEVMTKPSPVEQSYFLQSDRVDTEALQRLISVPEAIDRSLEAPKPRVLIIDEINRGNVSRIFGELITLIEPSKRAGASEALSTTLPYSKQPFSVPDNLYLIGTMNTADRSLAGLDIALRRRFVFEEMPPRPDLLDEVEIEDNGSSVNIGALLRVMNQRIELLLDRDHCLGHAYFMPLNDDPTLKRLSTIFQNQILPLLQEYFFEDWQRIAWVLNDHRKGKADQFLQAPQVDVAALFGDRVKVGSHQQRWTLNEDAFARIEAYVGIIEVSKESL